MAKRQSSLRGAKLVAQCRICKGTDLFEFLDLGIQPHCNSFLSPDQLGLPEPKWPLALLYCSNCHLVQLSCVVDPEIMFRNYLYVSGTTKTLPEHFRRTAEALVERFGPAPGGLVVDIGSNDGTFLAGFKELGMQVLGVDPATNLTSMANERGVETLNDFFGERVADAIRGKRGPAQLITAAGVFFHIDDMDDVCRGIARLLAEEGVFHVQAIYLGSMLRQTSFDNVYHEHVSYYTLRPLITLFERFGLEIFDIGFSAIHGGSLLGYVSHKGAYQRQPSVDEVLEDEHAEGWDSITPYLRFAERVEEIKAKLLSMLSDLKTRGQRIAAYGAPAKGNTLLNYCGIGRDILDFAAEKAPLKIGLYTPGMHVPIIDEDEAMKEPPAYFLLLPWNFKEELLAKNEPFRSGGGKFIVPIPTPEIV